MTEMQWERIAKVFMIATVVLLLFSGFMFHQLREIEKLQSELRLRMDARNNELSKMPLEERPDVPQEIKDYIKNDHIMQDKLRESGERRKAAEKALEECRASKPQS